MSAWGGYDAWLMKGSGGADPDWEGMGVWATELVWNGDVAGYCDDEWTDGTIDLDHAALYFEWGLNEGLIGDNVLSNLCEEYDDLMREEAEERRYGI